MSSLQELDIAQQDESYAHKKFKSSASTQRYTHKKFGTRSSQQTQSASMDNATETPGMELTKIIVATATPKKSSNSQRQLFRPYALGEDTPRKRKINEVHLSDQKPMVPQQPQQQQVPRIHSQIPTEPASSSHSQLAYASQYQQQQLQQQQSQYGATPYLPLNKQALSLMLQKQRTALYMSNILRYNMAQNGRSFGWTPAYMPNMTMPPTMLRHGC